LSADLGANWRKLPGLAVQVAAASDGTLACLNAAGNMYLWNASNQHWMQIRGRNVIDLSMASATSMICLDRSNQIFTWNAANNWLSISIPFDASNIISASVGFDGEMWCVDVDGTCFRRDGDVYEKITDADAVQICVVDLLHVYIRTRAGQLMRFNGIEFIEIRTPAGGVSWIAASLDCITIVAPNDVMYVRTM
jgi:hypothetical protein